MTNEQVKPGQEEQNSSNDSRRPFFFEEGGAFTPIEPGENRTFVELEDVPPEQNQESRPTS